MCYPSTSNTLNTSASPGSPSSSAGARCNARMHMQKAMDVLNPLSQPHRNVRAAFFVMPRKIVQNITALTLACAVGTLSVLVVWGCLGSWQISAWVRAHRAYVCGTRELADLTMYAADRSAAWTVGDVASPLEFSPDVLIRSQQVLPRVVARSDVSAITGWSLLFFGIGTTATIGVSVGALFARQWIVRKYEREILNDPHIRATTKTAHWKATRHACLSAGACAACAWFCLFDRSALRDNVDDLLDIPMPALCVLLLLLIVSSSVITFFSVHRAVSSLIASDCFVHARLCNRCRYPRAGIVAKICPECGTPAAQAEPSLRSFGGVPILLLSLAIIACIGISAYRDNRRFGWNTTGPLRWITLRSCYIPSRPSGFLLEGRIAVFGSRDEVVFVSWLISDKHTGSIEVHVARGLRDKPFRNNLEWVTTRFDVDTTNNTYFPPHLDIDCNALHIQLRLSCFGGTGHAGILLPFTVNHTPDSFDLLD